MESSIDPHPHAGLSFDDVAAAAARIAGLVKRTPVIRCAAIDDLTGLRLFFKCENLQETGSFKARGACSAVFSLTESEAAQGVATHSSGNHAAALARAAGLRGIACHIVMPRNALRGKVANVRRFGVEPCLCDPTPEAREAAAAAVIAATGAVLIHPFDAVPTMAGQGTLALEFLDEAPDLDEIVAPVGGGGLMAGIATAARRLRPEIRITAAEPSIDPDAMRSWESGLRQSQDHAAGSTIADGLRTGVGQLCLPILLAHVDRFLLASEFSIAQAAQLFGSHTGLPIEPSGAVSLAAVLQNLSAFNLGSSVGVVVSGGNGDTDSTG